MNPRLPGTGVGVVALAGLLAGCSPAQAPKSTGAAPPRAVQTVPCEPRPMERIVAVSGSLAPQEQATISVKVSGRVKTMAVDIGSSVPEGELIAQIEPRDYELRLLQAAAALAQARALVGLPLEGADDHFDPDRTSAVLQTQALLEEASRNHDRIESLFRNGVLAKSELDGAQSAHSVALNRHAAAVEEARTRQAALAQRRAEFEIARQQIADTTVLAPFAGIIQSRLVSPGEFLSAGAPVVQLVQGDPLRLRLQVPEREALGVRQGQLVRLTVEGDANAYTGTLARISPAIDERARVLLVEADVPSHGALRPGLFARAQIITRADDPGLSVPLSALVVFAGIEKVLTVEDGKAVERPVTTGRRGAGWVEIASGLRAGEPVVSHPGNLRSGQPVVVSASGPEPAERASVPSGP